MILSRKTVVSILDRPGGAGSPLLESLVGRVDLRRLLPGSIEDLDPKTEVLLIRGGFWTDMPKLLALAPTLKWIHVNMAGVDHLDHRFLTQKGVLLTNAAGVLDGPIAEFVLGSILLWSKGLHRSVLHTSQLRWEPREPLLNHSLRTLILGAGGIGTTCAKLLKAAGFGEITGLRRSLSALDPVFDRGMSPGDLDEQISNFDVVISCLPAAPDTESFLHGHMLKNLKERMVFVNIGRGATVNHTDLAQAFSARPDALAVLDVTAPEPLPPGHPLWQCANVVISPHMAGETIERHENFSRLFISNLDAYLKGSTLQNAINTV